jgi:hypothetical protein
MNPVIVPEDSRIGEMTPWMADIVNRRKEAVRNCSPHRVVEPGRLESALQEPGVPAHHLATAVARHTLESGIDVGNTSIAVGDDDRFGYLLDGRGEPIALSLGLRLLGDVDANAGNVDLAALAREGKLHDEKGVEPIG